MMSRVFGTLILCAAFAGCAPAMSTSARRTVAGVAERDILIAAQHVLAKNGYETETVDLAGGKIVTVWNEEGRKSVQYDVQLGCGQNSSQQPAAAAVSCQQNPDAVVVSVTASVKKRAVGGDWSTPLPDYRKAESALDDIVALIIERYTENGGIPQPAPQPAAPQPQCGGDTDCPGGQHCTGGQCVSECSSDSECAVGNRCDERGRCVAISASVPGMMAPPPPPPPPPGATVSGGAKIQ